MTARFRDRPADQPPKRVLRAMSFTALGGAVGAYALGAVAIVLWLLEVEEVINLGSLRGFVVIAAFFCASASSAFALLTLLWCLGLGLARGKRPSEASPYLAINGLACVVAVPVQTVISLVEVLGPPLSAIAGFVPAISCAAAVLSFIASLYLFTQWHDEPITLAESQASRGDGSLARFFSWCTLLASVVCPVLLIAMFLTSPALQDYVMEFVLAWLVCLALAPLATLLACVFSLGLWLTRRIPPRAARPYLALTALCNLLVLPQVWLLFMGTDVVYDWNNRWQLPEHTLEYIAVAAGLAAIVSVVLLVTLTFLRTPRAVKS